MRATLTALCLLLVLPAGAAAPALLGKARRSERAGWVQVHLEGSPRAIGFQHGYLMAKEIKAGIAAYRTVWFYTTAAPWQVLLDHVAAQAEPKLDEALRGELDGMVEGLAAAGVSTSRVELTAYNGMSEFMGYWWPQEQARLTGQRLPWKAPQHCSAFLATGSWTKDGAIVMGHNTHCGYQDPQQNIVFDIVPDRGQRLLMQGVPGWVHSGTDFLVTGAGLVITETTIGGFLPYDPQGVPEFMRMRRAAQDATDIDGWVALMKKGNNGGYANAWLVGDVRTGEIARLELGLRHVAFERTRDGFFVGSNIAEDHGLLRWETNSKDTDISASSVARRVRWKQLMAENKGRIDLELAKAFEADHWDAHLGKERKGGRNICGHYELDSESYGDSPFMPSGCVDAKVVDSAMARRMSFAGRYGAACGTAFDAETFFREHPQFAWCQAITPSRPSQAWAVFSAE